MSAQKKIIKGKDSDGGPKRSPDEWNDNASLSSNNARGHKVIPNCMCYSIHNLQNVIDSLKILLHSS